MERIITATSPNIGERSIYAPKLDELKGEILFKKKLERAEKTFSETIFPQEIVDFINREISK
ncbi:MAG: hypothetical protein RLZZ306_386 [Bacteroidota bacterium]|jgi:hypothetical protein